MNLFLIIILGLVIGSFLNVCIFRIPKHESINYPPSHCDKCKKRLKPLDLIPVLSYILFKGKCRYCGEKIDGMYPIVELLNSLLYVYIYLNLGLSLDSLKFYIFSSILIVVGIIDFKTTYIYSSTVVVSLVVGVSFILFDFFYNGSSPAQFIYGGILGFVIIELIRIITAGMGNGDSEIAAVCGVFLGIKGVLSMLLLSITMAGFIGIVLLILKNKKKNDKIPFVPFMSVGGFLSILYGNEIINEYIRFLFGY